MRARGTGEAKTGKSERKPAAGAEAKASQGKESATPRPTQSPLVAAREASFAISPGEEGYDAKQMLKKFLEMPQEQQAQFRADFQATQPEHVSACCILS